MGIFSSAPSAALVGEELALAVEALEHSARTLDELPVKTPADNMAIIRRSALAKRLRRAL